MPWALGKRGLTQAYAWFLARWARRLSWKEVAVVFRASWENVFRSVEMAVAWGRAHRDLRPSLTSRLKEFLKFNKLEHR